MASSAGKRSSRSKRSHSQSEGQDIDFSSVGHQHHNGSPLCFYSAWSAGQDAQPDRALEGLMGLRQQASKSEGARASKAARKAANNLEAANNGGGAPHPVDVSMVHNALLYGAPMGGQPVVASPAGQQQLPQGAQVVQMLPQPDLAQLAAQGQFVGGMHPGMNGAVPISTLAFLAQGVDPSCKKVRLDSAKHHAEVERDRRGKLNGAIEQLRSFFPDMPGPKHLVIERAVAHIEQLRFELHQLRNSSDSNSTTSNSTASRNQSKDDQNAVLEADRLDALTPTLQSSAFPVESALV